MQVDGLEGLHCVEQLYLDQNYIKELNPQSFMGLDRLQLLHMGGNGLKNLAYLGDLPSLDSLDLTENMLSPSRLGALPCIDSLSLLPELKKLWLTNNPVCLLLLFSC